MDYPFSIFVHHITAWPRYESLTDVTLPGMRHETRNIGTDSGKESVALRIRQMLRDDDCTPEEKRYRADRFFIMCLFIATHHAEFRDAGMDSDDSLPLPLAVYRAVHETFSGDPLRHPELEPVAPVIALAKSYAPKSGK